MIGDRRKAVHRRRAAARLLCAAAVLAAAARGFGSDVEYNPERPGNSTDDPIKRPRDLSGRAVKCPRVRAVHSTDSNDEGATAYLTRRDPWLGYQRGRELFVREFSKVDGVFGESGRMAGPTLTDEATNMITRGHVASCTLCHHTPFRDGGAGATIFKNGGTGRNTPHLFGAGLIEMLGQQLRLKLLEKGDANRNGFIDKGEAGRVRAIVENLPAGTGGERVSVDFGDFGDLDNDGKPDLNDCIFVWYVDAEGKRISWARSLKEPGVAGYGFEVQVFGWGHGSAVRANRAAIGSTLRGFASNAYDLHAGMQACDPTLNEEPAADGLAMVSLAGAQQFFSARTRDRGSARDMHGVSMDDPDRDGVYEELSEGDMDLAEHFLLNHPAPAEKANTPQRERGRELFAKMNCVACHVPDWRLEAAAPDAADYTKRYAGDRRFFDLKVMPKNGRLEGSLVRLTKDTPGGAEPLRGAYTIRGVYSDFVHHDLGPAFHQLQFDGSTIKKFRTAPLWGAGVTAPYGHDGASLDLDAVIRRHGGEADAQAKAYAMAGEEEREAVLAFLRGLVLYGVDDLPCDVDGDGTIAEHFTVAGQDTGVERLNPEWLFKTPGRIEGWIVNGMGERVQSFALTNAIEAYGGTLMYLMDADGDGFPDHNKYTRTMPMKPKAMPEMKK